MSGLPLSGERVIEDAYKGTPGLHAIYLMHVASYRFAQRYTVGRRVLDLGCGSGYGSALVATGATDVVAVDVSRDAIAYAANHHGAPNLVYQVIRPGESLPFADASFDVVLSFQVIEHVADDVAYIAEARRVMREGGTLIVITPNRTVRLLRGQKPWNRWHLREYDAASLTSLFDRARMSADMYYMTVSDRIAAIENKRYRRLKWLTLPFTLPFLPEPLRVLGLNLLHAVAPKPKAGSTPGPGDLDESEIDIGRRSNGALNLVAIAEKNTESRAAVRAALTDPLTP